MHLKRLILYLALANPMSLDKDCKVVVSTRNRKVVGDSNAHIYDRKNLSDEGSLELFCFYAFSNLKENKAP